MGHESPTNIRDICIKIMPLTAWVAANANDPGVLADYLQISHLPSIMKCGCQIVLPLDSQPDPSLIEEAKAVIRGGLGKAELEFIASVTAPLFWILRRSDGTEQVKSGSVFFLDAGKGVFAVTASHVVEECLNDTRAPTFVQCMIGGHGRTAYFHLGDRIIDAHHDIDIATLRVSRNEVELTGHTVLTGYQKAWPPRLPEVDRGVTYCGFPGIGRRWLARREISFGCVAMGGIATSSHETTISIQVERENLLQVFGDEQMSENFDFGGMSGGPLIAIVQTPTLRSWMPAGVVFQGPNPSNDPGESIPGLEIFRARPMHFVRADGTLDIARWEQSNPR
jgi:hypothetical protein